MNDHGLCRVIYFILIYIDLPTHTRIAPTTSRLHRSSSALSAEQTYLSKLTEITTIIYLLFYIGALVRSKTNSMDASTNFRGS